MELLSLDHATSYRSPAAEKVCRWLAGKDLTTWADKQYPIDGDDFYVNIFHYPTAEADARIWEAHRDYIDVHLVLGGREWVRQAFLADCAAGEYQADRDYQAIDSSSRAIWRCSTPKTRTRPASSLKRKARPCTRPSSKSAWKHCGDRLQQNRPPLHRSAPARIQPG